MIASPAKIQAGLRFSKGVVQVYHGIRQWIRQHRVLAFFCGLLAVPLMGIIAIFGVGLMMYVGEEMRRRSIPVSQSFVDVFGVTPDKNIRIQKATRYYAGMFDEDEVVIQFNISRQELDRVLAVKHFVQNDDLVARLNAKEIDWARFWGEAFAPYGEMHEYKHDVPMPAPFSNPVVFERVTHRDPRISWILARLVWDPQTGDCWVLRRDEDLSPTTQPIGVSTSPLP